MAPGSARLVPSCMMLFPFVEYGSSYNFVSVALSPHWAQTCAHCRTVGGWLTIHRPRSALVWQFGIDGTQSSLYATITVSTLT